MKTVEMTVKTNLDYCGCVRCIDFKFSIYKNMMRIDYRNSNDGNDYGFVELNKISNKKVTYYNEYAAKKVMNALATAKVSTQKLKKIAAELQAYIK